MTELLLYDNMLESLPASLFHMKSLEMLNIDRNHLAEIPDSVRRKGGVGRDMGVADRSRGRGVNIRLYTVLRKNDIWSSSISFLLVES